MIFGHGDDIHIVNKEIVANFSSNVFYGGVSKELQNHLVDSIQKINNYPEVSAISLQNQLAHWHHSQKDEI